MNRYVSIGQAALMIGVSVSTLRRWEKAGYFHADWRTTGNHRRYDLQKIRSAFIKREKDRPEKKVIAYARVSGRDQSSDLKRQEERLIKECKKLSKNFEVISDLDSGINYKKKGPGRLLKLVLEVEVRV